jgi:hypothetical protein
MEFVSGPLLPSFGILHDHGVIRAVNDSHVTGCDLLSPRSAILFELRLTRDVISIT